MKKTIYTLAVLGFCFFLSGCGKSKDDAPSGSSTSLISKWNFIKATFKDSTTGEITETDDLTEGSYLRFDNNNICYSMVDGDADAGEWHYIDNNTGVFIETISTFDYDNTEFTIETLNEHSLVLQSKNIEQTEATLYLTK